MAYQALYRQWRPASFAQVVGQEAVIKTLRHQIESGRIAHAYLFCGCRGTGKTTLAKIMSRAINCQNPDHGDPCGECDVCRAISGETTLDVVELDAASNNSVDNIRDLLDQVRYPPQLGRYKVYIIDEVHMLSGAAFNALLKTLEEPPAHVVFILATTEPQKLPATILSRVQRYDFGRIPTVLMIERMQLALEKLGISAEDEALHMVARAAEGAMRDAFSILDMCVAGAQDGVITAAQTRDVLGSSDKDFLFAFAGLLAHCDSAGVMRHIDALMRSGREPQVFLREVAAHCRALMTVKVVQDDAASLLDVTPEDERRYREQAEAFSSERLLRVMTQFTTAENELRYASTPRIGLEIASLKACEEARAEDSSALLERIAQLEGKLFEIMDGLQSGRYGTAAPPAIQKPASERKTSSAESSAPAKKPSATPAPPPGSSEEVWKKALSVISKTEPPLFGILRNERFLGVKGNIYQLLIPFAKKEFTYMKLAQPARKEKISQILSDVAGQAVLFEPVLEQDASSVHLEKAGDEAQADLIAAYGRDMVQVDDGKGG